MWKILSAIVIITSLGLLVVAYAQPKQVTLPIVCYPIEDLEKIVKKVEEAPTFVGDDNIISRDTPKNVMLVLTHNVKTRDYSVFIILKNVKMGCVLSSGYGNLIVDYNI